VVQRLIDQLAAAARLAAECGDGPGQTAARLLRVVMDVAAMPGGAILTYDAARIRLVMAASRLDEMCRDALSELGAVPEVSVEVVTALRTGDPVLARAGSPLHRALCSAEEPGTAALLIPLRSYRRPTGLLVLVGPGPRLADGMMTKIAHLVDLLGHLVPTDTASDGGSLLVDVEPVTTIATDAVGGRVQVIDEMIVLDGATVAGRHILVELPDTGAARRLAGIEAPLYVNLAVPRGAEMLAAIRAEGGMQPATGYLATGGGGHATMLGRIEVTQASFDPDEVTAAVARLAPGQGGVLVVGCDSGAVFALRQTLARRRTTVRLAWDLPSAQEILGLGDVDVIVVDFNLPENDAHRLVVDAARSRSHAGVVLVPGRDPVADGFAVLFAHDYPPLSDAPPLDEMLETAFAASA
jgi:CheY-like chemotaxis protein